MRTILSRRTFAYLCSILVSVLGCNSEPEPKVAEPVKTENTLSTDDAIESLLSSRGESGEAPLGSLLGDAEPDVEKPVPQHYVDAPVQRIMQKYENGNRKAAFEAKMLGGRSILQHGAYEEYYLNGQVQKRGRYEYGKKVGEWTFWNPEGQTIKNGSYDKDKQVGAWKKFREDGSLEWIENYANGLADGDWVAYQEDSKTVMWRRGYKAGNRHGKWTNFHPDGSPHTLETYDAGERTGAFSTWNDDGKLISEGEFLNGKRHGTFRTYTNGKLDVESIWKNGVRQPDSK